MIISIDDLPSYEDGKASIIETNDKQNLNGKLQILGDYLLCIKESEKTIVFFKIDNESFSYEKTLLFQNFPNYAALSQDGKVLIPLNEGGIFAI